MSYCVDTTRLPILTYRDILKHQSLLPSRKILLDAIDERFASIQAQGIDTVFTLQKQLSSTAKVIAFSSTSGIPLDYCKILKREIGTFSQKPISLSAFSTVDTATLALLQERGIHTTKDYYESNPKPDTLLALCDLTRINGMGANAAQLFVQAGYRSVAAIAKADAAELQQQVALANAEHTYYKATLGLKDMQFCIEFAKLLQQYA